LKSKKNYIYFLKGVCMVFDYVTIHLNKDNTDEKRNNKR
jgi:hypothetical protein